MSRSSSILTPEGPKADARPRFVKIVRAGIARFLGSSEVIYREAEPEDVIDGLRKKLIEEAIEYLLDPSIGELADVLEVLHGLAQHDLGVPFNVVEAEAASKLLDRGGFARNGAPPMAMYVHTTVPVRHEDDDA